MITVKLTTASPKAPLIRQTPGSKGIWGNVRFIVDEPVEKVDWWVVIDNLTEKQSIICPRENTILITQEVFAMKKYDQKFLDQFGMVITSQPEIKHPNVVYASQGYPWHIGWFGTGSGVDPKDYKKVFTTYDELKAIDIKTLKKNHDLSVITSKKSRTEGQALRHNFISEMKKHFGERFDVFGAGINMIRDKWEGIAPYKYHFAIENHPVPHYWTEKLADTYLAGAYPIYYGCPNIYDYFSKDALTVIDIKDIPGSIKIIEQVLAGNYYEKNINAIANARELVLNKYNIFALIAGVVQSHTEARDVTNVILKPQKKPWIKNKIVETIQNNANFYKAARKIYRTYKKLK